jgi:hypothetical protein
LQIKLSWAEVEIIRAAKRALIVLVALGLGGSESLYTQQQSAAVLTEAHIKASAIFILDATDAGWELSDNEVLELGNVDARGTAISGAPAGDPDVNGTKGIPVSPGGVPLSTPDGPDCRGAFYSFFPAAGGTHSNQHPHAAICIFLLTFSRWRITCSAQLLGSSSNVTVDQLKWKRDDLPAHGPKDYTDFTTSESLVASGVGAWQFFYLDYGLLVEYEDGSGANTWVITYTLVTD